MKKLLYGTTALATAGLVAGMAGDAAAAERIKLGLSGYHQQWVVAADQNLFESGADGASQTTNVVDQKHNSEVCFIGETTLDNGLTFGVNVQLEANTSSDQIDESYLYMQSDSFGRVILGDENNAGYLLHVTAPNGGVSTDSGDIINNDMFANPGLDLFDTALGTTYLRFGDNDSGKITYITPRFAGFQLGASFIPQYEAGGDDNDSRRVTTGTRDNNLNNGWAGGINYANQFNSVGLQLSAGGQYGDAGASSFTGDDNDLYAMSYGAQVTFGGFAFGGAYVRAFQGTFGAAGDGSNTQFNSEGYTVGVSYNTGPYTIGLNYQRGQGNPRNPDATAGTNGNLTTNATASLDQIVLSGTYEMGPGIRLVGGLFAFDGNNGIDRGTSGAGTSGEVRQNNSGYGFATGVKLGF